MYCVGNSVYGQPALAGDHRVALDAFVLRELDGQLSTDIKAAGQVVAQLQQGKNIRERIHLSSRTIAKIIRTPDIDRISFTPIYSSRDRGMWSPIEHKGEFFHASFPHRCYR